MRDDRQQNEEPRFLLGALIRGEVDQSTLASAPSESLPPHRLARLERALGDSPGRGRRVAALLGVVLPVLGAAAAAAVLVPRLKLGDHEQPPYRASAHLTVETTGGVRTFAAPGREGELQFQDGSEVWLSTGARVRLVASEPARALVTVLQGQARFRVRHQARTDWRVEAGPFRVQVTGTAFTVDWAADAARFQVAVTEGAVRVEGAGAGMGLPLLAGQRLTADATTGDIRVWRNDGLPGDRRPAPAPEPRRPVAPAAPPVVPPEAAAAVPPEPAPSPAARSSAWPALLGDGAYQRIVGEAEAMGIERCLRVCSDEARMALADAARYQGRWSLARQVLATLTDGSPLGPEPARAQYLLGQIAEGEGDRLAAARAYERCEKLDGQGGYAALALGRLISVWVAAGDHLAARQAAERYLGRYPRGPHADEARRLVTTGP